MVVVVLALSGSIAHAQSSEHGMPNNAFLFEARLAFATSVATTGGLFGGGGGSPVGVVAVVPSLLVGGRLIGRLHIGLGFSFWRITASTTSMFGGSQHDDYNVVTIAPTFGADIVKSADDRVAFYVKLGIPLGPVIHCTSGAPCDNNFAAGVDVGLGVRYALHHMFALGLEAGFAGASIGPQRDNTFSEWNFYGGLVGSFFSGH
jgi:hypothetical protein